MHKSGYIRERGNNEAKFDARRYYTLFTANIKACCGILVACSLCAVILSYSLPKRYQAMSTIAVEESVISELVKGIAITPSMESKLKQLHAHLLSRNLLLKVASALDMDLHVTTAEAQEMLITKLRNNISIDRDEKKGLFYISYVDTDPGLASDFVNTMTRVYIEENTASKRAESTTASDFLAKQVEEYQKRIESAQLAIDAFKSEKGMHLGVNEPFLRQQIKGIEQQLEELRILRSEMEAKRKLYLDQAQNRERLREKEFALQTLLAAYTERHPAVVKMKKDIEALKASIEKEHDAEAPGTAHSAEYQLVTVELKSIAEKEKNLTMELAENRKELQELPAIRTELDELEKRKEKETSLYEQLVARLGQSEVSKQMEMQDKSVSFRVIDAAVPPMAHTSPKRYLIMLAGIVCGGALAGAWLVGNDVLRGKIRSAKDLERFGVRVLTRLPKLPPKNKFRESRAVVLTVGATVAVILLVIFLAGVEFLNLPYVEKLIVLAGKSIFS